MTYAIIKVINGNFFIDSEHMTVLAAAKTRYHSVCQDLWNASDVNDAYVMIVNEQLDCVEGYKEYIYHKSVAAN